MTAKERHRKGMLEFWGNPDNDFVNRSKMYNDVLKISGKTFYKHFTPEEIQQIEFEAEQLRRKNSARQRSEVIEALRQEAKNGNVSAAKEFLDRTEGKVDDNIKVDAELKINVIDSFK